MAKPKLSDADIATIKQRLAADNAPTDTALAREYGVDRSLISHIKNGTYGRTAAAGASTPGPVQLVPLDLLTPSYLNPRRSIDDELLRELAASIEVNGLLQNLVARRDTEQPLYWIVAGERRYRAITLLAKEGRMPDSLADGIPCRVIDVDDGDHLALALLENLQRVDVNPMDEAEGLARLIDLDPATWTTRTIADRLGCSQRHVQQRLALVARLSDDSKAALREGRITATQARTLTMAAPAQQAASLKALRSNPRADIDWTVKHALIPIERAIFQVEPGSAIADSLVTDDEGKRFFSDKNLFLAAQRQAVAEEAEVLEASAAWVKPVEVYETHYLPDKLDHSRWIGGICYQPAPPEAASEAGVLIVFGTNDGEVRIYRDVRPKPDFQEDSAEEAERQAEEQRREGEADLLRVRLAAVISREPLLAVTLYMADALAVNSYAGAGLGVNHTGVHASDVADNAPLAAVRPWLKEGRSGTQEWRADKPGRPELEALRSTTVSFAFALLISRRVNCHINTRPLAPILIAIAEDHGIELPAWMLPAQTDIEGDAIAGVDEDEEEGDE